MKGPSIDAIRKFKEQQELKKQQEDEKKLKDKLTILEHRASQGDRKAKQELKRIEKVKEERNRAPPEPHPSQKSQLINRNDKVSATNGNTKPKPKRVETDFDELMKLAKNNKNEIRREDPPIKKIQETKPIRVPQKTASDLKLDKHPKMKTCEPKRVPVDNSPEYRLKELPKKPVMQRTASGQIRMPQKPTTSRPQVQHRMEKPRVLMPSAHAISKYSRPTQMSYRDRDRYVDHDEDDYDDDDEDDYEQDDFVVDDEDDDVQDEISKTIRSVFKYDKRRCDRREEELDRQYRAIGRVSTFEDLEREERRASRLAAAEDARAQRDEDERKRLKKARLNKMQL